MSSRKSTRIQPKNDNISNKKYTFFDDNSCREKRKKNCASTSLISATELSELSEKKSLGEECNVPGIVAAEPEEICVKNEEVLEQRDFLTLKMKKDTESKPGNARKGKQSKSKRTPRSSLSEEELLELGKKRAKKSSNYCERLRESIKVLDPEPEQTSGKPILRKYAKRSAFSEEQLLEIRKRITQQEKDSRERQVNASEDDLLKLRYRKEQRQKQYRTRKEIELTSLSEDERLKLQYKRRHRRNQYYERKKLMTSSLPEEDLLKLRYQRMQQQMRYRQRLKVARNSLSEDELLKIRNKRAQQQKQYRERKKIAQSFLPEDELLKIRNESNQRRKLYRKKFDKEVQLSERVSLQQETNSPCFTSVRDKELQHENGSSTIEEEGKELEMCSGDTESKLVPEQPIEQVFPTLTLEKVLELRWEKVKQTYFSRSEKENDMEM